MIQFVVLGVMFVGLSSGLAGLDLDPRQITVAIEYDLSTVQSENLTTPDVADIQNAEGDPEQFVPECSTGVDYVEDPRDCGKYYQCASGIPHSLSCPAGLHFSIQARVCDWPVNVDCAKDDRHNVRRIGRLSGTDDGAQSTALCPDGFVPVNCISSDPRRSDGTFINGTDCVAVNGQKGLGQRAIATCVKADGNDYLFVTSGQREREPHAVCPQGHRVINCLLRNAWNDIRFAFPSIDVSSNTCSADITCLAGWGCSVQAVCRRT